MDPEREAILERHPKLYFPDGDVVLAAKLGSHENPPKYQLSRVHKFLLTLRSQVFANLFADANAELRESYDGVPRVDMQGDRAEDLTLLLSYLYDPETSLTFRRYDPNTPIAVSGVIRLADKYLLEGLRGRLVKQVVDAWPQTLHDWDVQQAEIEAMKTAAEFGCPEILPAAFYQLLLLDFNVDWALRDSKTHYTPRTALARWSLLDRDNLARYVQGVTCASHYRPFMSALLSPGCSRKLSEEDHPCFRFIEELINQAWTRRGFQSIRDPLHWMTDLLDPGRFPELFKKDYKKGLCQGCQQVMDGAIRKERQRIWQELLPRWFKLQ